MERLDQADVLWQEFSHIHGHEPGAVLDPATIAAVADQTCPEPPDASPAKEQRIEQAIKRARYYASVHALQPGQSALCLSGGGVRSAAFCLGVIQGLAQRKLLSQFHYLSTVSGGGYIGAWLTAFAHRRAAARPKDKPTDAKQSPFEEVEAAIARRPAHADAEIAPMHWLRRNQRYLTPRAGMLSGDTWAGAALFLRDLALNWLVFMPAIAAVLLLPRLLELWLAWWASVADHSGSVFGWLMITLPGWLGRRDPAQAMPALPDWRGWTDAAGAALALVALATMFRARCSTRPLTDSGFLLRVLLPLLAGGWLITMFNTVTLAGGVPPDTVLLSLWSVGVPLIFIIARLASCIGPGNRPVTERPWRDLLWDMASLAASGAATGGLIWTFLWIRSDAIWGQGTVRDLEVFGEPGLLLAFFGGQVVYTALACRAPFGRREQEWMGRAGGFYLLAGVIWAIGCSIVVYGEPLRAQLLGLSALAGVSGGLTLAGAVSAISKANATLTAATQKVSAGLIVQVAALLFLLSGAVVLTEVTDRVLAFFTGLDVQTRADQLVRLLGEQHLARRVAADGIGQLIIAEPAATLAASAMKLVAIVIAALLAVSIALSMLVDVNLFSLHALYRNRLVRSFLGASNLQSVTGTPPHRSPFDGFSETDDVPLDQVWRGDGASQPAGRRRGPYPVINIALNLVSGPDPAWQERKAAPFIATPFHLGGEVIGYMTHDPNFKRRTLSLGTAMAISGAAASPNWGYHSSPLIGFLMTLFNVRLGWWLENPRRVGDLWFPLRSFRLFLQEALGQTNATDPYVYLSDGGHFDNLGLYEMLRRRCRLILAVDATQDANVTLDDLGRTLRQVSIDLGIVVEFDAIPFHKRTDPASAGLYATIGTVSYPEPGAPKGTLIYVKPGFLADAPADVRAYAAADPKFPHDSTFNQWFTESQFESYRTLGAHVAALLCGKQRMPSPDLDLADLPHLAAQYLRARKGAEAGGSSA